MLTSKVQVWLSRVAIAVWQQTKGKTYTQNWSSTKISEKEQHVGKQTLHLDWFTPHFPHRFVTTFRYDGTIKRHLGARNNQSAIRNQPKWQKCLIQSFYYPLENTLNWRKNGKILSLKFSRLLVTHDGGKLTRVARLIPSGAFTKQVG